MNLSVIIPAFNEAAKIERDVVAAGSYLNDAGLSGEIIVVDDGSVDGTADAAGRAQVPAGVGLRVVSYSPNRGKGHAVREGMLASKGEFVMFADSGLPVPYECATRGLDLLRACRCDLAHGSRRLPESVIHTRQSLPRRLASAGFRRIVPWLVGVGGSLTDTQCGFKLYRGDIARRLYGLLESEGFTFDLEIVLRARTEGLRILEFPVEWSWDPDSRLKLGRTFMCSFGDIWRLRHAHGRMQAGIQTRTQQMRSIIWNFL